LCLRKVFGGKRKEKHKKTWIFLLKKWKRLHDGYPQTELPRFALSCPAMSLVSMFVHLYFNCQWCNHYCGCVIIVWKVFLVDLTCVNWIMSLLRSCVWLVSIEPVNSVKN
jgi:hypothetical protein